MAGLTDKKVQGLEPPNKGRRIVSDDHRDAPRGFGVRINAGGKKTFVLRYNMEGKDRQVNVGEYPTWSLAAARKQATDLRRQIDSGVDILEERKLERAEPTLGDVAKRFMRAHTDQLTSGRKVRYAVEKHLIPALGDTKIKEIRRRDVIEFLEGMRHYNRQTALMLQYVKQIFAYAEDRELIEASPVATLKPKRIAPEIAPRKRSRVLSDGELRAFWNNAEASGMNRITALALKFVLVTGQRPGEVVGMAWEEVEGDTWTIPASRRGKTETAHAVPLTATARAILEEARGEVDRLSKRRKRAPAGYVFEARGGSPMIPAALSKAVGRYAEILGNQEDPEEGHWRPHDLRRTMRTGLAAAGVDELVAETTIGHTRQGIAAVYDLHKYEQEKRRALEAWERRLLRNVEGQELDNVVPLGVAPDA